MVVDPPRLLVADIGGTTTRLAVDDGSLGDVTVLSTAGLRLAEVLGDARARSGADAVCVAFAGPVEGGRRATLTNTGQHLDLSDVPGPSLLVNDLHATAAGILALRSRGGPSLGGHAVRIGGGVAAADGPVVVIGIGTGLGEAFIVDGQVIPGEGGHRSFAPADAQQDGLLRFLRDHLARTAAGGLGDPIPSPQVEVESVVSGLGLDSVLAFAVTRASLTQSAREALRSEPAASVVCAHAGNDPACALALDLFVRCAGAEAGALAIQVMASGGVYLCGGIPPRIIGALTDGRFRESFERSQRMASILKEIPVFLSMVRHPALEGAVSLGRARLC